MMSTGLPCDHVAGSTSSRRRRVSGERSARVPPRSVRASAASTAAPPPLVMMARRSPLKGWARASVSAASKRSVRVSTRSMPARRMAASKTRSEPASAPVCEAAALAPGGCAAGLDQQHRLVARRGARGGHELARRLHRFDVHQDGACVRVAAEVVEHVAEVDVAAVAERDEMREPDLARLGPVQQRRRQCARLRDEGQRPRQRRGVREAGVEADARHQQADAVRPQDAQHVGPRGVEHGLAQARPTRRGGGRQARGDDHRRPRAAAAEFVDDPGHRGCRRADHREVGRLRQARHVGMADAAGHGGVLRVDRPHRPAEAAFEQVAHQRGAQAVRSVGSADHGHRARLEESVEVADAHGCPGGRAGRERKVRICAAARASGSNIGPADEDRAVTTRDAFADTQQSVARDSVPAGATAAKAVVPLTRVKPNSGEGPIAGCAPA